jgi:hypothetical protein
LHEKVDMERNFVAKSVAMLVAMSIFHLDVKFSTGEVLAVMYTLVGEGLMLEPIVLLHSPNILDRCTTSF